nr:cytochrome c oxidase subunit 3 [Lepidophthirus macrorhini]
MKHGFHPFHIVDNSPWPIVCSSVLFTLVISSLSWMSHSSGYQNLLFTMVMMLLVVTLWWRDVVRESYLMGSHTKEVISGLKLGMVLFILSEVMFFFSFFFSWFYISLVPEPWSGYQFPPLGVQPMDFMKVPLLNTILLLSSSVAVTWAHHEVLANKYLSSLLGLSLTVILGLVFIYIQLQEYKDSMFTIADSVYGSLFYIMTGFHGLHVIIGVSFLIVSSIRIWLNHCSMVHHVGMEASIWYWHFVDVVWMFLFISVYCWQ